jgi:putative transposase
MVYLYCAVDKEGDAIDFMLSKKRDEASAQAFFLKRLALVDCQKKLLLIKVVLTRRG